MKGYKIKIKVFDYIYILTYNNKKDCLKYLEQCLERRTLTLIEPIEEEEIKNFDYMKKNTQYKLEL